MEDTDVAVIIPTFNHAGAIARAVQSVLDQSHPPAEVIVVDDGSTDNTSEALAGFGEAVRVVRQENSGVAAARNLGVRMTTAPLLAFVDADDAWRPTKLERQVERIVARPALGLVTCSLEEVDESGRPLGQRIVGRGGWIGADLLLLREGVAHASGSTVLIPRRAFESVGGYDERLSTSADWDLSVRIAARYPADFVSEPLVLYTLREGGMHLNVASMERDTMLAYEKIFALHPDKFGPIRREALSNLFMMLGASYCSNGNLRRGAYFIIKSVMYRPARVLHVAGYPGRRIRRLWKRPTAVLPAPFRSFRGEPVTETIVEPRTDTGAAGA